MKIVVGVMAAALFAAVGWSQAAQAQVPQGSYLSSCDNIDVRGNALVATCRRAGGGAVRTSLAGVNQCTGDIGNNNGVLQCNFPGGAVVRGQVVQGAGGPPPGYRQEQRREERREERREDRNARCWELQQRAEDLRAKRDWAWYPNERARFDYQLREVRDQQRDLRCR